MATTYTSLHHVTAEDVKVGGSADAPYVRVTPGLDLYFDSRSALIAFGAEVMRQGQLAAAKDAQARAVRIGSPVLGTVES